MSLSASQPDSCQAAIIKMILRKIRVIALLFQVSKTREELFYN
ncbi:hypothetical protein C900_00423 [Fulvivirga imtechensis AK7]|uniref:Uncharacterized protein n=1 Tax=Fulvivirga imtechensis AK7 TaxID=1237149 RepID=L8JHQ4_9BACT|nr:hypothetical protein C900_00423 [Fulvivirga imtechensis AK7]